MCRIQQLVIRQFRNLTNETLTLGDPLHLFYGDNGAGKSSLLEAIVTLATGKSWRSSQLTQLIQHGQSGFALQATIQQGAHIDTLSMQRHQSGRSIITLSENPSSLGELAKRIPTQLISTHSYRYLTDGPKSRRAFFNWGLFHVEPSFQTTWQHWQKVLKQRNASLKRHTHPEEVHTWDESLVTLSNSIDTLRRAQHLDIKELFQKYLALLEHPNTLTLQYERGWSEGSLAEQLKRSYRRDCALGYTHAGPQKADFQVYCDEQPAAQVLSQGQQKLAMVALHLAQVDYLKQKTEKRAIVLLDDLTAELDQRAEYSLLSMLQQLDSQTFITCIDPTFLDTLPGGFEGKRHHIKQGALTPETV